MDLVILGGGLASLTLAYFMQNRKDIFSITILEKEDRVGGLCRSFDFNGIKYDIGPHIIFSKDNEILELMNNLIKNVAKLRRSNRIIHKDRLVQYPFENDLSKLPEEDLNYCINAFFNNPYENYNVDNMLQFFLKTFGEGITNLYLRPYNEKIWKYDPAFMDTQMVERIPKPTKEEIMRSSQGETVDGYLHQLYFTYPEHTGIELLIQSFKQNLNDKVKIHTNCEVRSLKLIEDKYSIDTQTTNFSADKVISTIPLNMLTKIYAGTPLEVIQAGSSLRFNSIIITMVNVKHDRSGDNFAFMIADKDVLFHRISKVDFLGSDYHLSESTSYMVEITYRPGDIIDLMGDGEIVHKITEGLIKIGFIEDASEINAFQLKKFEYAYVVYDLEHKKHTKIIRDYFSSQGILLHGRFGDFEYLNMDAVIRQSKDLCDKF